MKKAFLLVSLISLMLAACSESQSPKQESDADKATSVETNTGAVAPKHIIASFYPLAFMAGQIVGDKAQVTNMAGSVDVHAYEPSPQDLVKLNEADLVVYQGAELEPWTEGLVPQLKSKGVAALEVSHGLEMAKMEGHEEHDDHGDKHTEGRDHDKEGHHEKEGHHDEHHKEESGHHKEEGHHDDHHKEESGHDDHHHGEFDPHTWLDPVLAQKMVDKILNAIVTVDSANESIYRANAQTLKNRFALLDEAYQAGLSNCANEKMIISHDAYGYLARRYGFQFHSISGLSPQDEPSAKILAELKHKAEEGISHILIEENKVRRFADTLARETGLQTLPINPLGRGTLDPQKDFFDIMEENLNSFKTALNCQQ